MIEKIVKNPPEENTVIFRGYYEDSAEIENLTIPEGMAEIGENAFRGFVNLKCVTLPKSMKRISACAFAGCENLEKVVLNYGLDLRNIKKRASRSLRAGRSIKTVIPRPTPILLWQDLFCLWQALKDMQSQCS